MNDTYPLVSVVVLTWNRLTDLLEVISEVKRSSYKNIEIIIVDNNSTDGTVGIIKERHPDINLIVLKSNTGISGYNIGMKKASGKYIVLLDSDSFPEKQSIEKMVGYFEEDPTLGVAAFDVMNYDYRNRYTINKIKSCVPKPIDATGYNGAGVGLRQECLKSAGYYYDPFFLYFNEQEHALRVLQTGYKIRLFTDLLAFHKQSKVARSNEKMAYYYTRNILWLIWRHYPVCKMVPLTFRVFFLAFLYTLKLKKRVYVNAVFDAITGLDFILKSRSPVNNDIIQRVRLPINLAFTVYG